MTETKDELFSVSDLCRAVQIKPGSLHPLIWERQIVPRPRKRVKRRLYYTAVEFGIAVAVVEALRSCGEITTKKRWITDAA